MQILFALCQILGILVGVKTRKLVAIYDFNWYGSRPLENFLCVGKIDNVSLDKDFFDVAGWVDQIFLPYGFCLFPCDQTPVWSL